MPVCYSRERQTPCRGALILLRNLNLENCLCNETRLIVRSLGEYVIKADLITGNKAGLQF